MLKIINQMGVFFGYDLQRPPPKLMLGKNSIIYTLQGVSSTLYLKFPQLGCKFVDPNKCYVCQFPLMKATFLSKVQYMSQWVQIFYKETFLFPIC